MDALLEARELRKSFSEVEAVKAVSFDVRAQEIFGLLGPNGAGKTTLVRMLIHLILPDSGSVQYHLNGETREQIEQTHIGYLAEDRTLNPEIPVIRTLIYHGVMRGIGHSRARESAERWLKRFGLADRAGDKVGTLSKGNQQKIQFAAAILHKPKLAVLDEPFSGLDPLNQEMFLELIKELREEGMTVILSAHQMDLVERIADRILLLNKGEEILSGTLDEIRNSAGVNGHITFRVKGKPKLEKLMKHPMVIDLESHVGDTLTLAVKPDQNLSDLLRTAANSMEILSVRSGGLSLRDIYLRLLAPNGDIGLSETSQTLGSTELTRAAARRSS
jgi:ABC-2 type transport system ATP-binding protein